MHFKKALFLVITILASHVLFSQSKPSPVKEAWIDFKENKEQSIFAGLKWNTLGPVINSGRVESFDVVPGHPEIIYAGFGSGNLWKTNNQGLSWKSIFDDHAGYSIGDIKIAPSDSNILYVGTGESLRAKRGHTISGAGIYRSDDAGKSWKSLGLENTHHIGRISIHPENPNIVFVAAMGSFYSPSEDRGIYKSSDGGKNWKKVLYYNERVGGNDVIISHIDPDIMYASTWYCSEDKAGPGGSIYKSIDGGETWQKSADGFPSGKQNGRTGLAISMQDPDIVYAFTDNVNAGYEQGSGELYKTTDGGKSWKRTHDKNLKLLSSYGEVFTDCFVNPQDDDEVYILGASVMKSMDGGKTFKNMRGNVQNLHPSPANYFHLDHHHFWINPANSKHIISGNDGGIYISYDGGENWLQYNNLPVGEFYFVRTDNDVPYNIYSGTQDDSSVRGPAKTLKSGDIDGWEYVWIDPWSGGDGIVVTPDRDNSDIVYYESQNGEIRRKVMSTGKTKNIKPKLPEDAPTPLYNEWLTPFFTSIHQAKTLYYGANYVFKSSNSGDQWKVISPDLSISEKENRSGNGISAIEESPIRQGLLYAGTSKGAVWVSKNDGKNWIEISHGLPAKYVKSFAPSKYSESRIYCTLSGIGEDDMKHYVYVSENFGESWEGLGSNLPVSPVNVILEDPVDENILYCGTFNGVFISMDRGKKWEVLGDQMPNCFVADMTIQEREDDLIAVTHGRGIYKMDLESIHKFSKNSNTSPDILHLSPAMLPPRDASGGKPNMHNHKDFQFSFYSQANGKVRMKIEDEDGKEIFAKDIYARKGLNTATWDLVIGKNEDDNPYLFRYYKFPEPGTYTLKLQVKDVSLQSKIKITDNQ